MRLRFLPFALVVCLLYIILAEGAAFAKQNNIGVVVISVKDVDFTNEKYLNCIEKILSRGNDEKNKPKINAHIQEQYREFCKRKEIVYSGPPKLDDLIEFGRQSNFDYVLLLHVNELYLHGSFPRENNSFYSIAGADYSAENISVTISVHSYLCGDTGLLNNRSVIREHASSRTIGNTQPATHALNKAFEKSLSAIESEMNKFW